MPCTNTGEANKQACLPPQACQLTLRIGGLGQIEVRDWRPLVVTASSSQGASLAISHHCFHKPAPGLANQRRGRPHRVNTI
jgi:hypothetical protein